MFNKITSMNVLYGYLTSDHFVLSVKLDNVINEIPPDLCNDSDDTFNIKRVHWDRLTCDTLSKYTDLTDLLLHDPDFVCDSVYCSGGENCSEQHKQDLILLYEKLTRAMKTAGEMTFPESAKSNFTPVPGWKELLETPYNEAHNAYLVWRSTNRPRSGPVHKWMKRTRAKFKYAQKVAKRNLFEDTFRSDAMAAKFYTGDIKGFWKCVKDYNTGPIAHSNKVDNASGPKEIASMWQKHYTNLFNSVHESKKKSEVLSYCQNINANEINVTTTEMYEAVAELPKNKASGYDGLMSEHFQFASPRLNVILAIVLQSYLKHGFLPDGFMITMIVPIWKTKMAIWLPRITIDPLP